VDGIKDTTATFLCPFYKPYPCLFVLYLT